MKAVRIGNAEVIYTPEGCVTHYPDGTSYGAHPHDTPDYDEIAKRCGYWAWGAYRGQPPAGKRAAARLAYCREHEVCHHIVGLWIKGGGSDVIGPLAHGVEPNAVEAVLEEAMVMTFQRWLRANERPIIGNIDWDDLKRRALEVLDA